MNRSGFTLLLVLLAVVALELLALSSIALSTHEQVVVNTQVRTVRARRQADAALHDLIRAAPFFMDSIAVGERRTLRDSQTVKLEVERFSWGTLQLTATVRIGNHAQQRSMMLRRLDAERAYHELNDALIAAGPLDLSLTTISLDEADVCTIPFEAERPARRITVARAEFAGPFDEAVADSAHAASPAGYALGGLRWSELAGIADTVVTGTHVLPDTSGSDRPRLIYAPGDLLITGGDMHGLLAVQGNLQLRQTRFAGIVVVGGGLDAENVEIEGGTRTQGRVLSRIVNSDLHYGHCAVARALLEAAAARRAVEGGRRLLPTF